MEEQWIVDRAQLRDLLAKDPDCPRQQLAAATGRSLGWVKKWVKRLRGTDPADETVLHRRSSPRQRGSPCQSPQVVERILDIRDHPPANLRRVPGPKAILYYLAKDEALKASGVAIPRSTRTVWAVLCAHGRIARPQRPEHQPLERAGPMAAWEIDFKDVASVPADLEGKQQHVVEIFNVVDTGTSILLESLPREDYNAETAILALVHTLLVHGLPDTITLDRDPRFVTSWGGRDFPSPFIRLLLCLGIEPDVCPPQRPDLKPFVERFHRTQEDECLRVHQPKDLTQTTDSAEAFKWHYNQERPNQALSCGNRPPHEAFPDLPRLPKLPDCIDPDRWLRAIDGKRFKRRVKHNGSVSVDKHEYYVSKKLRGRYAVLQVDAPQQQFVVWLAGRPIKQIKIKGLYGEPLAFADYLALLCQEAVSDWRRWQRQRTQLKRFTN
jgi:hypothetical protein